MKKSPEPFTLQVPDAALADLRERLARTRFPDQPPGEPWAYGTDVGWMRDFVAYWRDRFDWRAEEARLNALLRVPARDRAAAAFGGRADLHRHPPLDGDAPRRPLRRDGTA